MSHILLGGLQGPLSVYCVGRVSATAVRRRAVAGISQSGDLGPIGCSAQDDDAVGRY
jgi:hypothetical protein